MGVEEKNRNETLSRLVADLFDKSRGGEELSSKIHRLGDEIKKVVESEDSIFGKLRGLVESFEEIIPEEKQRYHAAMKALSTTSKLSRQEIVKAVNNQLAELKILEKGLMPALPGWRDELKVKEAKSKEMREEITRLREKIGRLESEEKGILAGMAVEEKEMELVETAMKELFSDIGTEITSIKRKVEEFTAESAAARPILHNDSIKTDIPGEKSESSEPQDTELQKKCPMCGGRMDLNLHEEMWQCYSCAYEELQKDKDQGKNEEKSEQTNAPQPAPASEQIVDPSSPLDVPFAPLFPDEFPKSKKGSSPSSSQPSGKKKACPVCHKKMDWYEMEKTWRCPFCDYQRSI